MRNPLASPRFRRRLLWTSVPVALAAAVALLVILFPNTGKRHEVFTNEPIQVFKEPKHVPAGPERRAAVLLVASDFIKTAVRRQDLDSSWKLVDPSFKQGYTRKQWDRGDIPVVPFPAAGIAAWKVDWSYENDIGMDIVLEPEKGSRLGEKSFMVELRRSGPRGRWLVASWVPHGVSVEADLANASKGQKEPKAPSSLGGKWLVFPLLGLVLVLVVPLAVLAGRGWVRQSKAERAYRASLRS